MSHVPHELSEEFPDAGAAMAKLKAENAHFVKLAERYHELNRDIHRAETDVEPCSDDHMNQMRRERLHLKDQIAAMLADEPA